MTVHASQKSQTLPTQPEPRCFGSWLIKYRLVKLNRLDHNLTYGDRVELALNDNNAVLATVDVNHLVQFDVLHGDRFVFLVFLTEQ